MNDQDLKVGFLAIWNFISTLGRLYILYLYKAQSQLA